MDTYIYEIHYRNNDDDPWQTLASRNTTDRELAEERARYLYRKANGHTAVRIARRCVDDASDFQVVANWQRSPEGSP